MSVEKITQINISKRAKITLLPSLINNTSTLLYSGGGGKFFNEIPSDNVFEGMQWHFGNPLNLQEYKVKGCDVLSVSSEEKLTYSKEFNIGLFDYSNGQYYWNPVTTNVLGIYSSVDNQSAVNLYKFNLANDRLYISTNDVNSIPRVGDYIVFNKFSSTDYTTTEINSINSKFDRLKVEKNRFMGVAKILNVNIQSGSGINTKFYLVLDKTFEFNNQNELFGVVLLNRENTAIQKDLYHQTFEPLEINREQLLGDPFNNIYNINIPVGRSNYLNYKQNESLGYVNLIQKSINLADNDPVYILELNNEIRDRISTVSNTYTNSGTNNDIHFELHLPGIMVKETNDDGSIEPNIAVVRDIKFDDKLGTIANIYFRHNEGGLIGYIFSDLRIIVVTNKEIISALSYNSNRNFVLPQPQFKVERGNTITNQGVGINIEIINASNTSPIQITTRDAHNLQRGTKVFITGVLGNTAANGVYYIDTTNEMDKLNLYVVMPIYNQNNVMVTPGAPSVGNGNFISGVNNSSRILSSVPYYNYFFTYRIKTNQNSSIAPYSSRFDFNFTVNNNVSDENNANLYINIPSIRTSNKVGNNASYNRGFDTLDYNNGYGIDVIIGSYETNPENPSEIIGIKNVVFIPIQEMSVSYTTTSQTLETGLDLQISKQDYINAIGNPNRKYDILNVTKIYDPIVNQIPETLRTSEGKWFIGNVNFKNEVKQFRSTLDIKITADKWNTTTNPTFSSTDNINSKDKYITEIAIYDKNNTDGLKPILYTKIAPPIKKTSDLDLNINLKLDF